MRGRSGWGLVALVTAALSSRAEATPADDLGAWWTNGHLMRLRDAYIEQEVDFIEEFSAATQSGYVSVPEWRCTVAENTFAAHNAAPWLNTRLSEKVRQLLTMRMAWQQEVIHFYCLGVEFAEDFDPGAHQQNCARLKVQRAEWQPSHKLAGPKATCPVPSGVTGITDQWWHHDILQRARTQAVTVFLAQASALANVLGDTGEDTQNVMLALLQWQSRGSAQYNRCAEGGNDPLEERHHKTAMELMRGFREEVIIHVRDGVPIAGRWTPQEFESVLASKGLDYRCIYRKLTPEVWTTRVLPTGTVKIYNYRMVNQ